MELKSEDFEKLQYNVYPVDKQEDLLNVFPELSRFPEFVTKITKKQFIEKEWVDVLSNIDKNKVLRYIFLCYDKKTPFISEKNLIRRKIICAKEAGFVIDEDGRFSTEVEEILGGYNEIVNRMIVRFVRNQRDLRYALLVSGMENYYDNITKLTEIRKKDDAKAGSEKTNLFNSTKDMLADLELMADEVFNNDKDLMYVADQIGEEESGKITSYPEYYASLRDRDKDGDF